MYGGGDEIDKINNPIMTRRMRIAFIAFTELNRERDFNVLPTRMKPCYIKEVLIREYHSNLTVPISYKFFKALVQSLDDQFIDFCTEQMEQELENE